MKRPQHIAFWIFFVLFCLSMLAGVCELFGVSVCLFGTPLHGRLAVPICLSFLALTICAVRALKQRRQTSENPHLYRLLSVCVSVLCAILLFISIPLSLLTATSYADSRLSDDHVYKVFFEESTDSDEPIAHVYKRFTPFLAVYRNSAVLYGFSGEMESVEVVWSSAECTIQYPGYQDEAESADDLQMLSRKIPYEKS